MLATDAELDSDGLPADFAAKLLAAEAAEDKLEEMDEAAADAADEALEADDLQRLVEHLSLQVKDDLHSANGSD